MINRTLRARTRHILIIGVFVVIVAGCTPREQLEGLVPKSLPGVLAAETDLKAAIVVTGVETWKGPRETRRVKGLLEFALKKNGLLSEGKPGRYRLTARWDSTDVLPGTDHKSASVVMTYTLRRGADGPVVYHQSHYSFHIVKASRLTMTSEMIAVQTALRMNFDKFMRDVIGTVR